MRPAAPGPPRRHATWGERRGPRGGTGDDPVGGQAEMTQDATNHHGIFKLRRSSSARAGDTPALPSRLQRPLIPPAVEIVPLSRPFGRRPHVKLHFVPQPLDRLGHSSDHPARARRRFPKSLTSMNSFGFRSSSSCTNQRSRPARHSAARPRINRSSFERSNAILSCRDSHINSSLPAPFDRFRYMFVHNLPLRAQRDSASVPGTGWSKVSALASNVERVVCAPSVIPISLLPCTMRVRRHPPAVPASGRDPADRFRPARQMCRRFLP